jgi:hypothetical protein
VERVEEFQYEDLEHTTVSTSQWDNSSDANYILSEILSDGSKIKSPIQIRCYARQMCIARSKMISPREPVYRWGQCNNVSFKSSDIVDILGSTFEIAFGKIPSL